MPFGSSCPPLCLQITELERPHRFQHTMISVDGAFSMDGWMDGVDLILYASRIPPRPANLRWQRCFGCRRPTVYPLSATRLLLHCSWTAIASKGCLLRAPERSLGAPRCHLEASGCHLEASGRQLGGSGRQLGGSWRPSSYNAVNTLVFKGLHVFQGPSRRMTWVVGGESAGSPRGVGGESAGSPRKPLAPW